MNITKKELDLLNAYGTDLGYCSERKTFTKLHRKLVRASKPCVWKDCEGGEFRTSCGNTDDISPDMEVWSFCPFCGRKVEVGE